jgi:hypothetical protein
MYKNLKVAIAIKEYDITKMAEIIGMSYSTFLYKIHKGKFYHEETKIINEVFFKKTTLKEFYDLFERTEKE